jgi:hypothetical protein
VLGTPACYIIPQSNEGNSRMKNTIGIVIKVTKRTNGRRDTAFLRGWGQSDPIIPSYCFQSQRLSSYYRSRRKQLNLMYSFSSTYRPLHQVVVLMSEYPVSILGIALSQETNASGTIQKQTATKTHDVSWLFVSYQVRPTVFCSNRTRERQPWCWWWPCF